MTYCIKPNDSKPNGIRPNDHLPCERQSILQRRVISKKTKTANGILAIIKKCFLIINAEILKTLYKTLVRPHLEYANQSWKPYLKKHILMLESVQRRATRLVPGIGNLSYEDRLKELNISTLEYRRRRGRMIEVYKILNECYDGFRTFRHKTFRQQDGGRRFGNFLLPKRLWCRNVFTAGERRFGNKFSVLSRSNVGAYSVYARSPSPSQRPAPTTIASRSPFPLGLCSCSTSLSKMEI